MVVFDKGTLERISAYFQFWDGTLRIESENAFSYVRSTSTTDVNIEMSRELKISFPAQYKAREV